MDSNLNFVRRTNKNLQFNFRNIDYRSTCTATSLGVLTRNTTAQRNNDFVNVDISNIKLYNIFIDVPADTSINNTITLADNLTYGITGIFIQLSTFTGSITLGFDKLKCVSFYGSLTTDVAVPDGSSYIDYYDGVQK